ncbi:MAG: hypothetical protein QW327_06330, partial [Candidatus Odinarchaeota archaeon]
MSGLFEAAMTVTPLSSSNPSSSVSSWLIILSVVCASPIVEPLAGVIESSSSKNIIHGAACLAFLHVSRT